MGSRVPVWPIFRSPQIRRATATASKDVKFWGLSKMIMPFIPSPFSPAAPGQLLFAPRRAAASPAMGWA